MTMSAAARTSLARRHRSLRGRAARDDSPRVLVAIRHPAMRALTGALLERQLQCRVATEVDNGSRLRRAIRRVHPDVVVVDVGDFPTCCRAALDTFPHQRVVVIGPEPDPAYGAAAFARGAGAWLPRDRVGEEIGDALRRVLEHDGDSRLTGVGR